MLQEKNAQGRRKAEVVIKVKMANESHLYPKDHYEIYKNKGLRPEKKLFL